MSSFIYKILVALLNVFSILLVARVVFSWIGPLLRSDLLVRLIRVVYMLTEPVLRPVRSMLFKIRALRNMPVDFSPIIVIVLLSLLQRILYFVFVFRFPY